MNGLEGTVIDRYEIEHLLGRGGMGEVYLARHTVLGQRVALKFLSPERESPEAVARFVREARAAAAVDSPHIVKVSDFVRVPDAMPFFVMEWVDGRSLADVLEREAPLSIARAVAIARQILLALAAAHDAGIVHRDVKPSNVMLTDAPDGSHDFVKGLDFGLSKTKSSIDDLSITRSNMLMGTPGFMAPEQLEDARGVDARADLFSVAVMLFGMLTADMPFSGDNVPARMLALATEEPRPLRTIDPHMPDWIADVVDRGLSRDPDRRWQSAGAFIAALDSGRKSEAVAAHPRVARRAQRASSLWALGVVTAVLTAGVGFALWRVLDGHSASRERPRAVPPAARPDPPVLPGTSADVLHVSPMPHAAGPDVVTAPAPSAAPSTVAMPVQLVEQSETGVQIAIVRSASLGSVESMRSSLREALVPMEACRPYAVTESVLLFAIIDPWGRFLGVNPSRENTGDRAVARCAARALRSVRVSGLGTGGLQRFAVTLPARN